MSAEDLRAESELLVALADVTELFEAAQAKRFEEPEAYDLAKAEYQRWRSWLRAVGQANGSRVTITPATVTSDGSVVTATVEGDI